MRRFRAFIITIFLSFVPSVGLCGIPSCSVSTNNINFGAYNTIDTIDLPANNITVTCSVSHGRATVDPTVQLGVGSGTYASRTMSGPAGSILNYNLYTNSNYTSIFGDGTSGTGDEVGGTQTLFFSSYTYEFPVYAQLPGGQNAVPGSYTTAQPITVTVSY